ncbi:NfeD family protein [Brachyspira sp.]|uniref:NfeD family protein n=1 Tax=Brachyspira sp. TaxID=1977261 RepID=UPI003D7E31A2
MYSQENAKIYVIKKLEFQEINRWYAAYIKKAIKKAEDEGASLIILELDTPGGLLSSALSIKNYIIESDIPVVAHINKNALSAGALISLSCASIYMSDGSIIGAATPVYMKGNTIEKASEKEISAMRAAMRSSAERSKKNVRIAEAMVDETIILSKRDDGIDSDDKTLLTLSVEEALKVNIADGKANSIIDIIKLRNLSENSTIINFEEEKYDYILRFLINPAVLSALISIGIIGAYIELKTPGFGIGGVISIIAFSTFFFAQVFVGESGFLAPAIFFLGLVLLAIEIFVIPGFGITGILGILGIVAGIFMSFGINNIAQATSVIFFSLIADIILIVILARFVLKSKGFKNIVALETDTAGYHSSVSYDNLLGREGITDTFFRPSGNIIINDKKYDAITEGEFINKGVKIKVILVEGNKIVIKEVK